MGGYYAANREKILAAAKVRYASNKHAKKDYDRAYRVANRAKINARFNKWRQQNSDDQRAKGAARQAAKPEQYAATRKAWREKNAEYLKAYDAARWRDPERVSMTRRSSLAWKAAHPEARRNHVRNRRAKLWAGGVLSHDIEKKLMVLQRGHCPVCRADITQRFHLDHIIPVARGGRNDDSNAQLLCPPCNQSKGDKLPEEFMQRRGLLL